MALVHFSATKTDPETPFSEMSRSDARAARFAAKAPDTTFLLFRIAKTKEVASTVVAETKSAAAAAAADKAEEKRLAEIAAKQRADDLQRQEYKYETAAATVEREALLEAKKRLALDDAVADELRRSAIVDPKTASAVADELARRTEALKGERDRRLPAPEPETFVAPVRAAAKLQPLDDADANARDDARAADDLARDRLKEASEGLLLEANYLDDDTRAKLAAELAKRLVAKTSKTAEGKREQSASSS